MKKVLPILFIALIFALSCTDQKTGYLVGKWEDVPRVVDPANKYIWTFKDDNNVSIEIHAIDPETGETTLSTTGVGTYEFKRESFEFRLIIDVDDPNLGGYPVRGEYWVDNIERNLLTITREKFLGDETGTPFIRREFIKL